MYKMFFCVYNNGLSHELLPCDVYLLSHGLTPSTFKTLIYSGHGV
jgi:hypothetical protein